LNIYVGGILTNNLYRAFGGYKTAAINSEIKNNRARTCLQKEPYQVARFIVLKKIHFCSRVLPRFSNKRRVLVRLNWILTPCLNKEICISAGLVALLAGVYLTMLEKGMDYLAMGCHTITLLIPILKKNCSPAPRKPCYHNLILAAVARQTKLYLENSICCLIASGIGITSISSN